ncbi:hypothetical protein EVB81_192 [Rhizobium phage RHph_I46]|uniref:Uncharacterized protein n=1 Tax=Rhizobium phage RHph_I1_9 TaxID=2509729 RepID=A0A7S5R9R9_9CAUD|nr:hypothetical protein PP936_gp190 [Rhizobium phage RHph_I1_9]QIG69761.1 hypothetical protein EVB81_192 [Rhizobium phage RHph_I46]QIG71042.1 hypothetical protein EVB92_192 [Rhizobium phage RHph_I9]QIG73627.1 hypothetical protein EVC04_190 [Rhizobium phage RHph_I1_9]QIG76381.1 hypothetical protein EVC25_192 [Rhizobium phage RHph_I34]
MARSKREFVEDFILNYIKSGGPLHPDVVLSRAVKVWDAMEKVEGLNEKASAKAIMG